MPNQELTTLDAAHASRRFLSRTFKLDSFMSDALETYIMGKRSIVNLISNSIALSDIYESCVKVLSDDDSVPGDTFNLGIATHRFSSLSKRLGRFVGKIFAVFQTAEKMRHVRSGKPEAKQAELFLRSFSEEQYIMLSMMADASDEAYVFTAYCDDEDADTSLQAEEVAIFVDNCRFLFAEGQCKQVSGFTRFAIEQLRKPRLLNIGKNKLRTFGISNNDALVDSLFVRCLGRMKAWLSATLAVVQSEFPDFDMIRAFNAMALIKPRKDVRSTLLSRDEGSSQDATNIERLAILVKVDAAQLRQELLDHRPIARTASSIYSTWY